MSGYTKLFASILDSTVWQESKETRLVWIAMLVMKDGKQVVEASIPGLAKRAGVTIPECEAALACLQAPDPYSRTRLHDGRRIEPVEGGWLVLNGEKYREKLSYEERKAYKAAKAREYRLKRKTKNPGKGKPLPGEASAVRAMENGDHKLADDLAAETPRGIL